MSANMASDLQISDDATSQQGPTTSQGNFGQNIQRISMACRQCRSRKRRCDGEKPTCSNCVSSGQSTCQYPVVQKRRGAGKNTHNIKALENRLLELESKLLAAPRQDVTRSKCSDDIVSSGPGPSESTAESESPKIPDTTVMVFQSISTHLTQAQVSLPNHQRFREMPNRVAEMIARSLNVTGSFRSIIASPLPIHEAEISLLWSSAEEITQEFPLFDQAEFLDRAQNQATLGTEAPGCAAEWACVNAAVAIAMRIKTVNCSFHELSPWSWTYFKNAYATFPELVLHGNDIEDLQAMVLMALFARSSADARITSHLVSAALRLSQTLDPRMFKTNRDESHKDAMESEYARRALWAAFILDTELFLPSALTSALDPSDMGIALPNGGELPSNHISDVAIFRWRAELALIQTRVNKRLYTNRALNMPDPELLSTIAELDQELELWGQSLPPEVRPGAVHSDLEPSSVALHLAFHNTLSMIHWAARRLITTHPVPPDQSNISRSKVRTAAQNTLRLLHYPTPEQFAQFWRNLPHPLSSALTLTLCILEDPKGPQTTTDIALIKQYGHQVKAMQNSGDFDLSNLIKVWDALESIVNIAVRYIYSRDELSQDGSVMSGAGDDTVQTLERLLSSATHPRYIAQGLLTNLPNRDIEITEAIATILGVSWEDGEPFGPLVPRCMKPGTYGFGFERRVVQ